MSAKKCKRGPCNKNPGKYIYCKSCRQHRAASVRRALAANPEARKKRNRRAAAGYRRCQTPAAIAYRKRCKQKVRAASQRWIEQHKDRHRLMRNLTYLIQTGRIVKPACCDKCDKKKKLVAWGVTHTRQLDPETKRMRPDATVEAWYCWSCWWSRKKAA